MVEDAMRKARVLIEALPFFKRFHHQFAVVKVGGEAIERPEVIDPLLTDLVFLEQVGLRPVLVHGGGPSITKAMDDAGINVQWHQGRRVTDEAAIEVVQREVERLNAKIVNKIFEFGGAAIGLVPSRQAVVDGEILDPNLGLVGRPLDIDRERIVRYASRGLIPVVPPLSMSPTAGVLNTNADDVALAVARGLQAVKLVFCSNVPGVCRDVKDPDSRISTLTPSSVQALVDEGVIQGGMIPKIENCLAALEAGVAKIHIVHAATAHALLLEIFTPEGIGTQMVLDSVEVGGVA